MELTSLELSYLEKEFRELEEGLVQKVYQRGKEFTLEIYIPGEGKKRLIFGPSYAFLSKYKRDNPTKPPGFCMELRKHLGRIDKIEQRGFDRILRIVSGEIELIVEMFGKGNVILLKEGKIIGALKQEEWTDRSTFVGEEYKYPEPANDPREKDIFELMDGELVRSLASDLSLGGMYAEEICGRLEIDKEKQIEDLTDGEVENIREEVKNVLTADLEPGIYYENDLPKRPVPFSLESYKDLSFREKESLSEAWDETFYKKEKAEKERQKREKYEDRLEGLKQQKEQQERKIEGLKKSSEQNRETAEHIYENYQEIDQIKQMVEQALEEYGWDETREKLKEADTEASEKVKDIDKRNEKVTIEVGGETIRFEPGEDIEAAASRYYDKAKASEDKIGKVKKALEKTGEKIDDLEFSDIDEDDLMEDKTEKRSKKWFEKYRWFYSSDDFLILAGRSSQTNDMLVKKHMEKNDLYVHANFDGAPSVVIKDGQDAPDSTIEEAAKAAVTFTKTWKAGIGADDVYYVTPDQVSQEPESGEYLPKGAFIVRGDRNYIHNVKVEASIGSYELDDVKVPIAGPVSAISQDCDKYVELKPGNTKKSELAKKIRRRLDKDLDLDYIIRVLPPGKSDIK